MKFLFSSFINYYLLIYYLLLGNYLIFDQNIEIPVTYYWRDRKNIKNVFVGT